MDTIRDSAVSYNRFSVQENSDSRVITAIPQNSASFRRFGKMLFYSRKRRFQSNYSDSAKFRIVPQIPKNDFLFGKQRFQSNYRDSVKIPHRSADSEKRFLIQENVDSSVIMAIPQNSADFHKQ